MKKIFAIAVALCMVMALCVSVFAVEVTDMNGTSKDVYDQENAHVAIPEGIDTSDGAVITVHIAGHSDNAQFRLYLTNAGDANGRVSDQYFIDGGDFDVTVELKVELGVYDTDVIPTHVQIKGPDYQTPLANTSVTTFEFVGYEEPTAEPEASADEPETTEPEAPADEPAAPADEPAASAPETTAPATGLALAVVPAVVAMAAAFISKKH